MGLLVPGLWALGIVTCSLWLSWLPQGFWRQFTSPLASFSEGELDAFYLDVVLPSWLIERPSRLQRFLLLWLWAPLVLTVFASPVYFAMVLL